MNGFQIQILLVVVGVLATAGLLLLSASALTYHVTATHLKVTWLGVPVRRLRLEDIKRVGPRPVVWAERWPNCFDRGRMLVIRRHTGLFRNFVITPKFPFEFRNSIELARKALMDEPATTASAGEASLRPPPGPPRDATKRAA
jgi:hypothetical protein